MEKETNIDLNTLELLPVAVILFDIDKVYFLNKKAKDLFKVPKSKKVTDLSVLDFLNEKYHKAFIQGSNQILENQDFPAIELPFLNFKNEIVFIEAKSNTVLFNGIKIIQSTFLDISDRIARYKELQLRKDAEEKFNLISKNANDIIFFYTYYPEPKYIFISPSIKKVLGYSESDFYNNPNLCYSIVTDVVGYRDFETKITKQQKNNSLKYTSTVFQYKTKQGKLVWIEDNYSPIFDENGKIKFVLGISRDITKEKNYQLELEQKWSNYENLIETSPNGILIHKGVCFFGNKAAADIFDESNPKKLIGKNLVNYIIKEQQDSAVRRLNTPVLANDPKTLTYKIKTNKNKIKDIEIKTVPFLYNGESCLQTIIRDVSTDKKLAEETLRAQLAEKTNAILVKVIKERNTTQAKLNTIFNTSTHIIWSIDDNYKLTSFNQNYHKQISTYYDNKIEVGLNFRRLYKTILDAKDYRFWMKQYELAFKGENILFETEKKTENGEVIYREIYLNPTKDDAGKVTEVVALSHNITQRKITELKAQEQAAKLKAIFDNGNQLIWTLNRKYYYTSFNQNFSDAMYDVYQMRPKHDVEEVFNPFLGTENEHVHQWWLDKYDAVFTSKKSIEFTVEQINTHHKKIHRQIFVYPIFDSKNQVNEISCLSYDITEIKYLQSESLKQEQKVSSIFENTSHLIWTIDKNFNLTSFNNNFGKVFFQNYGNKPILKCSLASLVSNDIQADYIESWYPLYKRALNGEKLKFEKKDTNKKGNTIYREVFINPIKNEKGVIVEIACLAHDITENKTFELKILNQSAKLKAIFESGDQLMWTINKEKQMTSFNNNYANAIFELYNFYPKENKTLRELANGKTDEFEALWEEKYNECFSGKPVQFSTERKLLNGKIVHRQYYLSPIKNQAGMVMEVSGLGFDVTENKLNEEKIIQSLREKEVLLKEVHHRVKNNMQVISSILNLQSSYVNDTYALNLLKECQNRIKSMAFIHESLYQTKNFEEVNFTDYIPTLAKNLIQSYTLNQQKIKLILTLDKLFINLDTSIPCGLIINEIISNSLKYAFVDNKDGIIFVNLKNIKNTVRLEVGDNGKGIPKEIDIKQTKTLGLQLIDTLTDQIGGTLTIDLTKGTKFIIEFKI